MNVYFVLVILFNFLGYYLFYIYINKTGGWKSNFIIFIFLLFLVHFTFISPVYFYLTGRSHIWDNNEFLIGMGPNFSDYYIFGFAMYGLGIFCLLTGYIINLPKTNVLFSERFISEKRVIVLFYFFYFLIFVNFLISGINPLSILINGNDSSIIGQATFSNYLRNLADSLITLLLIGFAFKIDKKKFFIMIVLGFILFIIMGFRYRIILTLLGFFLFICLKGDLFHLVIFLSFFFFFFLLFLLPLIGIILLKVILIIH